MPKSSLSVQGFEIPAQQGLDSITVYTEDYSPGRGRMTILCYGCAWTIFFGAMNDQTIAQFVKAAGTDYLVTKLGITPLLKRNKNHTAYLARIIEAVKKEL